MLTLLLFVAGALSAGSFGQDASAPVAPVTATLLVPGPASGPFEDDWKVRREAAIHSKWNIGVDLQMVRLEEAKALELIPDLQSDDQVKVAAAWDKLQVMIKAKEAVLLAWPMVRMIDGGRAVSESINEKRYPTEFEPPLSPKTAPESAASPSAPADKPTVVDAIPTEFETRNIGATLEVQATVLGEGKRVHLDVVSQRVELLEMEKNESLIAKGKIIVRSPQPLFASSKTTESLTVVSGQRQLIAIHKLTKPAGFIELHFVRAVVTSAE
ncbi:MAG: hypothetical protein ABJF10_17130 [Chthoniobacter sp.]|uniref:hypothetical protein n=1 Tax=Chthoniobacter sp. TaxID=2510640 RepID=UPI0032AD9650